MKQNFIRKDRSTIRWVKRGSFPLIERLIVIAIIAITTNNCITVN